MSDRNVIDTQTAVQLTGPDKLKLNPFKTVHHPGPTQILLKVEAVGLCFSDMKMLHLFDQHVRKSEIISGLPTDVLDEIPSYVPGNQPTVPGHEIIGEVVEIGMAVESVEVGQRCLVQPDFRHLKTAAANAAIGYNFEGGLQEYVLLDERVIIAPDGSSMLLPAPDKISASALALVEPWACVEDSYATKQRRELKAGGRALLVCDDKVERDPFAGLPLDICDEVVFVSEYNAYPLTVPDTAKTVSKLREVQGTFDDVIYVGPYSHRIEALWPLMKNGAILNIVLNHARLDGDVSTPIGRIHYSGLRIIGTVLDNAADSYERIPEDGAIPDDAIVRIIGAGGPMGAMHTYRAIATGNAQTVIAEDLSEERLEALSEKAFLLAQRHGVEFVPHLVRPNVVEEDDAGKRANYTILMAPVPVLVGHTVNEASSSGIINMFAGISVEKEIPLDLNRYIGEELYMLGTSGSTVDDMLAVMDMLEKGVLDTNVSVAAVTGMSGAIDGLDAVKNQKISGKIIVYPALRNLGLTPLKELDKTLTGVAGHLKDGMWNLDAERALLASQ